MGGIYNDLRTVLGGADADALRAAQRDWIRRRDRICPTLSPLRGSAIASSLLDASLGLYQFDDLVVLAQATMPAVLLEAGVIVHREEERLLAQPAYRQRIAAAVVSAVRAYCIE